jgi:hypothetical protein
MVFGLCLGILWPATNRHESGARHWTRKLPTASAVALIAIVGYAGWDYIRISQLYLPRDERLQAYEENTLDKARGSRLFANQVGFAELTLAVVTRSNAAELHGLAQRIRHFSPEPRVIVKLIESAELLGLNEEALTEAERFSRAFPIEYALWLDDKPVDHTAP